MKLGVRAHDYGKHRIHDLAQLLAERGYHCCQLALPKAFLEIDSYEDISLPLLEKIRREFEEAKIEISVFGAYMDLGNPDEQIRAKAVKTFCQCLEWNQVLGAGLVGSETAYPHLSAEEKRIWKPCMLESVRQIVEAANRYGQKAAIEPVYWHPLENVDRVRELLETIQDPEHLKIIFDASNLLEFPNQTDQKVYWKDWLDLVGPYVEAMHIKDFVLDERGQYQGCLIGQGVIDYRPIADWYRAQERDIPLLREEMQPANDRRDLSSMRSIFG